MELITYTALAIIIGVWMYYDAKKRKLEQPATWLIVGILFSVLGLASYWYWHIYPSSKSQPPKK